MIKAVIRPEKVDEVANALDAGGFTALTRIDVFGRGKQKGLQVGSVLYDQLPKALLLIVVEDALAEQAVEIIEFNSHTGNIGDGKIFLVPVEEAYTVRTGEKGL
jgi:nitrogen regulatory protein PII 1